MSLEIFKTIDGVFMNAVRRDKMTREEHLAKIPQHFIDYQQSRGWVLSNGKKMVDWKATIRTWEQRNKKEVPVEEKTTFKDALKRNRK